jgi:hypothetical protein
VGSPSPLGSACAPSPLGVWLHRRPYPEFPTPISAAVPHCYSASARRHDHMSGCSASLRPSSNVLLCFPLLMCCSALPSAPLLPLPLSSLLPLPLWSVLSDRQPPLSPLQDLPRAPLSTLYFSGHLSARVPISPTCQLSLRTPVSRPESDPCMAPATHDLARIGRQSDDF